MKNVHAGMYGMYLATLAIVIMLGLTTDKSKRSMIIKVVYESSTWIH